MSEQKTIGVFGNSRGGTSVVAGITVLLGIHHYSNRLSLDDEQMARLPDTRRIIAERNAERDVWGFKNPMLLQSAPVLQKQLRNPRFIFVSRDPVASNLMEGSVRVVDHRLLKDITNRSERFLKALQDTEAPYMLVCFERLIQRPAGVVEEIAKFIGQPFDPLAVKFVDHGKGYQNVQEFIKNNRT